MFFTVNIFNSKVGSERFTVKVSLRATAPWAMPLAWCSSSSSIEMFSATNTPLLKMPSTSINLPDDSVCFTAAALENSLGIAHQLTIHSERISNFVNG